MKRLALLATLALLAACTDPNLGLGLTYGQGGLTVTPSASGNVGGAHVTISG